MRPWAPASPGTLLLPCFFLAVLIVSSPFACAQTVLRAADPPRGETPPAVPARPTITNPAHIPLPGYLQLEQGVLDVRDSPQLAHQFSIVQTTKLALTHHVMVQVGNQPWAVSRTSDSSSSRDTGDTILGAQVLFTDFDEGYSSKPTIAFALNRRIRSGTVPDLDLGGYSQGALLLVSGNLFHFHYDANALFNEQSSTDSGHEVRRLQTGQTLSVTQNLTANFSITEEIWHVTQPLVFTTREGALSTRSHAVGFLFTPSYNLRPNLTLDVGFDRGLTSTSTAWQGFAGFTYLLPHRLW